MTEKREGHGEDSDPLFIFTDDFCAVGVFDGMGGSGAAICKSGFGDHKTKAYVASRIVKEAIENYIKNKANAHSTSSIDAEGIKLTAKSRLEQEKSKYPAKASGLRSRLVRDYPTTLAMITSRITDKGSSITSYWAGDSRNFLWSQDGFFQISKDDLDTELDPLENLRNDAALSNCVCADRDFTINQKVIEIQGKYILISATDGSFGYFLTPMHFQNVLLAGLKNSIDENEWRMYVKDALAKVTGDDVSLSLCAVGYESFEELKASFEDTEIAELKQINNIQAEINQLTNDLEEKKNSLESSIQEGWSVYKESYLKYLIEPEKSDNISLHDEDTSLDNTNLSQTYIEETSKRATSTDESSGSTEETESRIADSPEDKCKETSEEFKPSEALLDADSRRKEEVESMLEEKSEVASLPENKEKRDVDSEIVSTSSKETKSETVDGEPHITDRSKSSYDGKVGLRGKSYSAETVEKKEAVSEDNLTISKLTPDDGTIFVIRQKIKAMGVPGEALSLFDELFKLIR